MTRRFLILLSSLPFAAIAGLAVWIFILQQRTAELEDQLAQEQAAQLSSPPTEAAPPAIPPDETTAVEPGAEFETADAALEQEERRLEELRERLSEVQDGGAQPRESSFEKYIERTNRRIAKIEGRLSGAHQGFTREVQEFGYEEQIQKIDTQILEYQMRLQNLGRGPQLAGSDSAVAMRDLRSEIEKLKLRRSDLGSQSLRGGEDSQHQLESLRADLEYWRGQQRGAGAAAQQARVRQLKEDVNAQEAKLNFLRSNSGSEAPSATTTQ